MKFIKCNAMTRIMSNNKEMMSLTMDHMKRSSYLRRFTVTALITLLMTLVGRGEAYSDELYDALVYSQNYEGFDEGILTAEDIGWTFQWKKTAAQAKIKKVSDDDNLSKYLELWYNDGGANRHQWWDFGVASKLDRDNWTLSFSAIMNGANNSPYKFFISGTNSGNVNTANTDVSNPVFALIGNATNGTEYTAYIANTAVATDVTLSKNVWYNFVVAVSDIDATQNTAVIHVKVTNYNDNATVFEATKKGVAINSIGSLRGICWDSPRNGSLLDLDNVKITMKRPKLDITYNKGEDTAVKGDAPVGESVIPNTTWTPPVNTSLYKSEYTLTGWTDTNDKVYSVGTDYVLNEDLTFSPLFRLNAVAKTDAVTNVTATFPTVFFTENGTEKYNVVQTAFNGETQDVYVKVDGKTLTFDAINGIKLTLPAGVRASDFTINSGSISADGQVLTYSGSNETVTLTYSGSAENVNGLVFTYPLTEKPVISTNIEKDSYEVKVDDELSLSITTFNMENGTYQWYSNTTASTEGAKLLTGANTSSFVVPTSEANNGVTYYYCVATNSFGSATSKIVGVTVNATPIIHTDIANDIYSLSIGDTQSLSVSAYNMQVTGSNYQWYSNTTQSTEGGTAVSGATSSTFSVPTAVAGTTYYYCVAENAYGKDTSKVVRVYVADYVIFDFKNGYNSYSENERTLGTKDGYIGFSALKDLALRTVEGFEPMYEVPAKAVLYPYELSGYFGIGEYTEGAIQIVPGTGLQNNVLERPLIITNVKPGEVVKIIGPTLKTITANSNSNGGRAEYDIYANADSTVYDLLVKTAGNLTFTLARNGGTTIQYIYVANRHRPTVTTSLDGGSHAIARESTSTLSIAATAGDSNPLTYQWYRADNDTIRGGREIKGATDSEYTTVAGESYYYYCVAFNSVTGTADVSKKTTHVETTPEFRYKNNDAAAKGKLPADEVIPIGGTHTVERRNYLMFKDGYTLKGWTDSTVVADTLVLTHQFGKGYTTVNDRVLYPYFKKNNRLLDDIVTNVIVRWPFATGNDAPAVTWDDEKEHILPIQAVVTDENQDLAARIKSTGFTTGSTGATVAAGTTIRVPVFYGTIVRLYTVGDDVPSVSVIDSELANPVTMSADGNVLSYKHYGDKDTITLTLGAGTYKQLYVNYAPSGMPKFANDLLSDYYCETGKSVTMSVVASDGVTYQWYKNTKLSNTGGTPIAGATSASYTATRSTDGSDYYYVRIHNNYGDTYSSCAAVTYYSYVTHDFVTWDAADADVYKVGSNDDGMYYGIAQADAIKAYKYIYPYGMAGYYSVHSADLRIRTTEGMREGLKNFGGGERYLHFNNMKKGQHIYITGNALNAHFYTTEGLRNNGGGIRGAGKFTVTFSEGNTKADLEMTQDGHIMIYVARAAALRTITLPTKYTPVITKDLDESYVVDKDSKVTLKVEARPAAEIEGQNLVYEWYKNTSNSNKGGTLIAGADSSSLVIDKVTENAFYYCLVKNSVTETVAASSPAAVGYYVEVTFNNNDAAAYGEAPKSVKVQGGVPYTIPVNQTLIKDGYTLTAWKVGDSNVAIGGEFTPQNKVTLTPVFTQNADNASLAKRPDPMSIHWVFSTANGSAEYNDNKSANVNQVSVNNSTIDVGIKMTKGDNQTDEAMASTGWLKANNGDFVLPVVKGAKVTLSVYNTTGITINGESIAYSADKGQTGAVKYEYTYMGKNEEITLNVGENYIKDITIDYPFPEVLEADKEKYELAIKDAKAASKSVVVKVTGRNLVGGSPVTLVKDAKGDNVTVVPEEFSVADDGTVSQEILVTYAGSTVHAADSTVLKFRYSDDVEAEFKVMFSREKAYTGTSELTAISKKTVWNWAGSTSNIKPEEDAYFVFSDITLDDGVSWPETITPANLAGVGTYFAHNSVKCFEGKELYFKTTRKGTVEVDFSSTASNSITLAVNDKDTEYTSASTSVVTTKQTIAVDSGLVKLSAHTTGVATGEQDVRIYKVTFTPDAEKPTIVLDAETSSFTITGSDDVNLPDDDPDKETIYYTIDGSEPSLSSNKYGGTAVKLYTNRTIKAIAVATNKNNSEVDSLTTAMKTYKLTVNVWPSKSGRVVLSPTVPNNEYTLNSEVTMKGVGMTGYGVRGWAKSLTDIADDKFENENKSYYTVTIDSVSNEFWAVFKKGVKVTVEYDVANAKFLDKNGNVVPVSNIENYGDFKMQHMKSPVVSGSITAPATYPIYTGSSHTGCHYSLIYWEDKDSGEKYELGTNTVVEESNKTVTLIPVYKQNVWSAFLETRKSKFDVTWHFSRSEFAHPATVASDNSFWLATNTEHVDYFDQEGNLVSDQTVDIGIEIDTKDSSDDIAFTNEEIDTWASIKPGTKIHIPSAYGAKLTLATYGTINGGGGGTTINGKSPDNVYDEKIPTDELGAYLYTWTIQNDEESAELCIGGNDFSYYRYIKGEYMEATESYLKYSSNNDEMGTVTAALTTDDDKYTSKESELGHSYPKSANVTVTAERKEFYELKYWLTSEGTKIYPDGRYQTKIQQAVDEYSTVSNGTSIDGVKFTGVTGENEMKYSISFNLDRFFDVQAVFGDCNSYYVNFSIGEGNGLALPVAHVEEGKKFDMPAGNYNLYKDGYTLKYYVEKDVDNSPHYEFGKSYDIDHNMRLIPVFKANNKSVIDITDVEGRTVTWDVSYMQFDFTNANGHMIAQLPVDDNDTIDVRCYFSVKDKNVSEKINEGALEVSAGAVLDIISTSNCVFNVKTATGTFKAGDVKIGTDDKQDGNDVSVAITTASSAQQIKFVKAAKVKSISVTYKSLNNQRSLKSVTIGSSQLSTEQLATLNSTTSYTHTCPASVVYDADNTMPAVTAVPMDADGATVDITQATIENQVATILMKLNGITIETYNIYFNLTDKASPKFSNVKVNTSEVSVSEGSSVILDETELQSTSGTVSLTFDHPMKSSTVNALGQTMNAVATGNVLQLTYWNLDPNTSYTLEIPASSLEDVYGKTYGSDIRVTFKTATVSAVSSTKFNYVVTHKILWDGVTQTAKDTIQFVADDVIANLKRQDIQYGTLEEGITLANKAGGTERFRIFVPNGEYNMKGTEPLIAADLAGTVYGKDASGNFSKTVAINITDYPQNMVGNSYYYYNGRSFLSRSNVSIVGQSQDSTVIYSDPRVAGTYLASTLRIQWDVANTYMQDLTLENRFCNSQGDSPEAGIDKSGGGASALYDNGYHTVGKNVTLKAHEGTYTSLVWDGGTPQNPKKVHDTDNYFEDCELWGSLYPLFEQGQAFWNRPTIILRGSSNTSCLSLLESDKTQKWGYVLKDGVVKAENDAVYASQNNKFGLGASIRNTPAQTLIGMKFDVAPLASGYRYYQGSGEVMRFHEYGSKTSTSLLMDLSSRSLAVFAPGAGSDECVLTEEQAAEYTLANVLGGSTAYDPTIYTKQVDLTGVSLSQSDAGISWTGSNEALCYFIFRQNEETKEFEFYDITTNTIYQPDTAQTGRVFYVRAANERGGLGKPSETIVYENLGEFILKVSHLTNDVGFCEASDNKEEWTGWSTICLPHNARVPSTSYNEDGSDGPGNITVYGAQGNLGGENNVIVLKKVSYVKANMGYIVYATTGESSMNYCFKYTWDSNVASSITSDSYLDGNPSDKDVAVGTVNCYTMAYKKTINPDCVGFYKFIGDMIPAHRAYLTVETLAGKGFKLDTTGANSKEVNFRFVFDEDDENYYEEDADGINDVRVTRDGDEETVFDLSGKRLDKSQLRKGMVYVIGGKKVLWNGE